MTSSPAWPVAGLQAVRRLRRARADSPTVLAVTEAALDTHAGRAAEAVGAVVRSLQDLEWASQVAAGLAPFPSVGVLSLGAETLWVLESARWGGGRLPELWTERRAVARGLGYLRGPVALRPAEHAAALLLPGVAADDSTLWTYVGWADTALRARVRGTRIIAVVHPVTRLSPLNRSAFRPGTGVVATDLPGP